MGRLLAEMLGTFALVFAGTGAIVTNDLAHGTVTQEIDTTSLGIAPNPSPQFPMFSTRSLSRWDAATNAHGFGQRDENPGTFRA